MQIVLLQKQFFNSKCCRLSTMLTIMLFVLGDAISADSYHLCHLLANGVYPLLSVIDVHSGGSAKALSKRQIWNLFSIDQ